MSELGDTYSKSLEEAQLGSDRYEKAIQLTWSVPFGESPQSVDALRSKINSKKSRIQLKQLKDHLMRSNKTLALQINSERKLADQLKKKIRLTQGVLEAQSKRYRRGKIDLEQVLIAEEQYSLAIKTYIDYFYQHYLHCAQLALQTNQFDLFLKGTAFKL
jgi:outer membrane protein TolC